MTNYTNPSTRTTGYKVTDENWNELVNNFKFLSETRSLDITDCFYPPTSNSAAIETVVSSIGTPPPGWTNVLYDAGTVEYMLYKFIVPKDYGSSPKVEFAFYGTATSGTVVFSSAVVGLGAAQGTNCNFGAVTLGTFAVNGTAGVRTPATISIADINGLAAGAKGMLFLCRVGTATADNAGGDCKVDKVMFGYGF